MNIIEISNLTTSYGKARGIENVSLSVKEGEIFGFIGPNGAGKSTTIRTLLGFLFPNNGTAKVFGLDCMSEIKKIKYKIGYLPSEVNYYDDMRVKDLLSYSAKFYKKDCKARIAELCEIFQLDINKKIDDLSLGNKKKTAIVQALLHEPKLLIFDEPTSGLDPLMQNTLFDILKRENEKGTTIFFSSHVLSEVQQLCDRVAIIKEGRILNVGSIEELAANKYVKVKIDFANPGDAQRITLAEGADFRIDNDHVHFMYGGNANNLLETLSSYDIQALLIEELSLEEVFMHYYEKEGVQL